jgi:hypothetical protein
MAVHARGDGGKPARDRDSRRRHPEQMQHLETGILVASEDPMAIADWIVRAAGRPDHLLRAQPAQPACYIQMLVAPRMSWSGDKGILKMREQNVHASRLDRAPRSLRRHSLPAPASASG